MQKPANAWSYLGRIINQKTVVKVWPELLFFNGFGNVAKLISNYIDAAWYYPIHQSVCLSFIYLSYGPQATQEELKASYRRLCMLYHPDKHRDPELKRQAEQLFTYVHQAYEGNYYNCPQDYHDSFRSQIRGIIHPNMKVLSLFSSPTCHFIVCC